MGAGTQGDSLHAGARVRRALLPRVTPQLRLSMASALVVIGALAPFLPCNLLEQRVQLEVLHNRVVRICIEVLSIWPLPFGCRAPKMRGARPLPLAHLLAMMQALQVVLPEVIALLGVVSLAHALREVHVHCVTPAAR